VARNTNNPNNHRITEGGKKKGGKKKKKKKKFLEKNTFVWFTLVNKKILGYLCLDRGEERKGQPNAHDSARPIHYPC